MFKYLDLNIFFGIVREFFYVERKTLDPLCVHLVNELVITESAHFQVVSINS